MEAQRSQTTSSRAGRRTQQERREATRALLLEATVESLIELGYAATTTLEIERRARVSRGARIHHYPTKAALLADVVDHLHGEVAELYGEAFGGAPVGENDAERLHSGLRRIWSVYRQRSYAAVLELNMVARTDEELHQRLLEVSDRHRALAIETAAQYFGVDPELGERLVDAIHAGLMGLLLQRNIDEDPTREEATLSLLEQMVIAHLPSAVRS